MNKVTIIHSNDKRRDEIARSVAEKMDINYIDIQDYVLRGCVLHGDLDEMSREEFYERYDSDTYDFLEHLAYTAYTNLKEPFIITIDNPHNQIHIPRLKGTISVHVNAEGEPSLFSLIADHVVNDGDDVVDEIIQIITADERWSDDEK